MIHIKHIVLGWTLKNLYEELSRLWWTFYWHSSLSLKSCKHFLFGIQYIDIEIGYWPILDSN